MPIFVFQRGQAHLQMRLSQRMCGKEPYLSVDMECRTKAFKMGRKKGNGCTVEDLKISQ